jgi:hypothetical protein
MKEERTKVLTSTERTLAYLGTFVVGAVVYEILSRLMNFRILSNGSIILGLSILGTFIIIGAFFINERHILSRVTSAATLLILGVIALKIDHTVIPNAYLFAVAFSVSFLGAKKVFHCQLVSLKKMILYSFIVSFVTLILLVVFVYGVTVIDRIVIQQQYDHSLNTKS